MEINFHDSGIRKVERSQIHLLWDLFKEYHDEVSNYNAEQPLASEQNFKSFWLTPDKISAILYSAKKAIGFALLQKIVSHSMSDAYLEVGAIFVKKEFRKGLNGIRLYNAILDAGKQLSLPIASEVATNNDLSLKLARSLAKRYIRHKGAGVLEETDLKNGRRFLLFKGRRVDDIAIQINK